MKYAIPVLIAVLAVFGYVSFANHEATTNYCMHMSTLSRVGAGVGMISVDDLVTCQKVLGKDDFHRLTTNWAQRATASVVYGSDHFAVVLNGKYQSAKPQITDIESFNTAKFEYQSNWDDPFLYAQDIELVHGCTPVNQQSGVMYVFAGCAIK